MDSAPTVVTDSATDIQSTSFTANMTVSGGGNVTSVTERGFTWIQGSSGDPLVSDNPVFETGNFGNDFSWSTPISGLSPNTDYRVRAYAINSVGTTYGNTITATTAPAASLENRDTSSSGSGGISEVTRQGSGFRTLSSEGATGSSEVSTQGGAGRQVSSSGVGGVSEISITLQQGFRELSSEGGSGESSASAAAVSSRIVSSEGLSGISEVEASGGSSRELSSEGASGISEVSRDLAISHTLVSSEGASGFSSVNISSGAGISVSSFGLPGSSEAQITLSIGSRAVSSQGETGSSIAFVTYEERDITVSLGLAFAHDLTVSDPYLISASLVNPFLLSVELLDLVELTNEPFVLDNILVSESQKQSLVINSVNRLLVHDPVIDRV